MKTICLLLVVCISIFIFNACETTEKIDDFPLRPSQLVINCFFTQDSTWEFQVSKSLSVLDNADLKFINNATIKLFKDSALIETITEQDADSWYRSDNNLPEMGAEYSIEVSSPDFGKTLLAKEYTPQAVTVSNVSVVLTDSSYYEGINYDGRRYYGGNVEGNFNILFTDPTIIDNYYQLSIFYNDTIYSQDSLEYDLYRYELPISSDDGAIQNDGDNPARLLLTDNIFDGQDYQLKVNFNDWRARRGKTYYIELISLNRSGYLYRKSIDDYNQARNDPFAEPVMVYCNIENGYGIFSGYSTDTYMVTF